jgi:hypothetical protein
MGRPKLPSNPIRTIGPVTEVILYDFRSMGRIGLIDTEDIHLLGDHRWYCHKFPRNYSFYILARERRVDGSRFAVYLHRLILNAVEGAEIDHLDNDGLNNRKYNLRITSHSNNVQNRVGPRADNRSGFKGVYERNGYFQAQIRKNKKLYSLGNFLTAVEAARAYDKAAERLFGPLFASSFPKVERPSV